MARFFSGLLVEKLGRRRRHTPKTPAFRCKTAASHLGEALDAVRKTDYGRLAGRDRRYIKGQKYTLLSRKENLTLDGKKALKALLSANKRLKTAYVLKESFAKLWSYEPEGWARRFFENWRASLKWQRLKPYQKFAEMIDRHWDGIAACCRLENKVSLDFVDGLNNKIRVISGAPTASATRNIYVSKFSPACCRSYSTPGLYPSSTLCASQYFLDQSYHARARATSLWT